jgi:hypothetical protein
MRTRRASTTGAQHSAALADMAALPKAVFLNVKIDASGVQADG